MQYHAVYQTIAYTIIQSIPYTRRCYIIPYHAPFYTVYHIIYHTISCHAFGYCEYRSIDYSSHFPNPSLEKGQLTPLHIIIYKRINVVTLVFNSSNLHFGSACWICDTDTVSHMFFWIYALVCVSFQNGCRFSHSARRHVLCLWFQCLLCSTLRENTMYRFDLTL